MEKKICTKCGEEKGLSEYYIKNKKTNVLIAQCKTCINKKRIEWTKNNKEKSIEIQKKYRENNREKINERLRIYRENNKEALREQKNKNAKKYREKNKEKIKESRKIHRQKNKEKIREYSKNYRLNNLEYFKKSDKDRYQRKREEILKNQKEYNINNIKKIKEYKKNNKERFKPRIRKYMREYERNKRKTDVIFCLYRNTKSSIGTSLKRGGYTKKSRTYEILGCSYKDFKTYIELKFESWMTWDNKGLYNGQLNYGWDLDHIIPLSSAKTEEDLIKLFHYSNVQPLCSKINREVKKNLLNWNTPIN